MSNYLQLHSYDLDNHWQRRDAAGVVYTVAERAFAGSLGGVLMSGAKPYGWFPKLDGRTAAAKELKIAEAEMWKAIQRYDNARIAALKEQK